MVRSRECPDATALPPHLQRGQRAEALAGRFLQARGLKPLATNFRCRWGELDLVMTDGPCLVVVEVRYRARGDRATPAETVSPAKCRRLIQATRVFLGRHPALATRPLRFDVVGITGQGPELQVDWIPRAFTLDDVAGH